MTPSPLGVPAAQRGRGAGLVTPGPLGGLAARALPVNDPHDRKLTISCGAALFNLKLAARSRGAQVAVDLLPERDDPDLLARLRVTGRRDATAADRRLYQAIPRRRRSPSRWSTLGRAAG